MSGAASQESEYITPKWRKQLEEEALEKLRRIRQEDYECKWFLTRSWKQLPFGCNWPIRSYLVAPYSKQFVKRKPAIQTRHAPRSLSICCLYHYHLLHCFRSRCIPSKGTYQDLKLPKRRKATKSWRSSTGSLEGWRIAWRGWRSIPLVLWLSPLLQPKSCCMGVSLFERQSCNLQVLQRDTKLSMPSSQENL